MLVRHKLPQTTTTTRFNRGGWSVTSVICYKLTLKALQDRFVAKRLPRVISSKECVNAYEFHHMCCTSELGFANHFFQNFATSIFLPPIHAYVKWMNSL